MADQAPSDQPPSDQPPSDQPPSSGAPEAPAEAEEPARQTFAEAFPDVAAPVLGSIVDVRLDEDTLPGLVVRVAEEPNGEGRLNAQVFGDGADGSKWVSGLRYAESPAPFSWRWPT